MMSSTALTIDNVSKRYRISDGLRHNTLRDLLAAGAGSLFRKNGRTSSRARDFWALRDVSFEVQHGESVGILGLNGAGKSTLLKILSRITEPTAGRALITGRVGALLEVGTGFQYELSGRENTYLYGAILGMKNAEIRKKFDAIVDFAGIESFIDTPVKRYSSGMYVRLAFAVAAHLEPEILLLDEVLSVGDITFQRKCLNFAKQLQCSDATILFVSHNMFSIKTMCSRVIYLKAGQVIFDGLPEDGIALYEKDCRLGILPWADTCPEEWPLRITNVEILDQNGAPRSVFDYGERMHLRLSYKTTQPVNTPNFIVAFIRSDGVACCNYSSELDGKSPDRVDGTGIVELITPPFRLTSEMYTIHIIVRDKDFQKALCTQIGGTFHVRHEMFDHHFGVFHEHGEWHIDAGVLQRTRQRHYSNL